MYVVKSLNLINLHTLHAYIFMWWENLNSIPGKFPTHCNIINQSHQSLCAPHIKIFIPFRQHATFATPITWKSLCFMFLRLQHFSYKWEQTVLVWLALHSSISRLIHEAAIGSISFLRKASMPIIPPIGVGIHVFLSHIFISLSIDISNI